MHLNQLLRLRVQGCKEQHIFRTPIERECLSLPDNDRLSLNGFECLIRKHTPIVHASFTPAAWRYSQTRHHSRRIINVIIFGALLPLCNRSGVKNHFFKRVRRHGWTSSFIFPQPAKILMRQKSKHRTAEGRRANNVNTGHIQSIYPVSIPRRHINTKGNEFTVESGSTA